MQLTTMSTATTEEVECVNMLPFIASIAAPVYSYTPCGMTVHTSVPIAFELKEEAAFSTCM